VHGVVAGYYRRELMAFFATRSGHALIAACMLVSLALMLFSLNHPLQEMPDWARLEMVPADRFQAIYHAYFLKYKLGPGRVLNITTLLISGMAILTVAWKPIHKWLGWLFIPLGQQSMYVFFMHLFVILLVFNTPLPRLGNVWINTAIHALAILACWAMVKTRFLFRWVPH
jgi:hypothetical protein